MLVLAAGCSPTERAAPRADSPIAVTDAAGRNVQLDSAARRVVSLVPAVTDMMLALGLQDRLVARTQYDTAAAIAALPGTHDALNPSIEWVLSLEPDLVITWQDQQARSVVSQLEALGIATYGARTQSISDVLNTTRALGTLLGQAERADSAATRITQELAAVRNAVAARPVRSIVFLISIDPPMVAGPGTFVDELIQLAGGNNLFHDALTTWPQVSLEEIVRRAPDVVALSQERPSDVSARLRNQPGWRSLAAVQAGRVFTVEADLFNRPGPALPRAARRLAGILHPDSVR